MIEQESVNVPIVDRVAHTRDRNPFIRLGRHSYAP